MGTKTKIFALTCFAGVAAFMWAIPTIVRYTDGFSSLSPHADAESVGCDPAYDMAVIHDHSSMISDSTCAKDPSSCTPVAIQAQKDRAHILHHWAGTLGDRCVMAAYQSLAWYLDSEAMAAERQMRDYPNGRPTLSDNQKEDAFYRRYTALSKLLPPPPVSPWPPASPQPGSGSGWRE